MTNVKPLNSQINSQALDMNTSTRATTSSFSIRFAKASTSLFARVATNLNKIALPAIALGLLSTFQTAEAGPIAYGICVAYCSVLATPVLLPACMIACLIPGTAPLP